MLRCGLLTCHNVARNPSQLSHGCDECGSHETVRQWCAKFGQTYANGLRRRRACPGYKWHLDDVFIKVNGAPCEHLAEELSGRLGRREITLKRYDVAIAPLDKRISELRAELAELDSVPTAVADPVVVAASCKECTARWNAATVAERRNLIRQALPNRRIVITPAVRPAGYPKFNPGRIVIEEEYPRRIGPEVARITCGASRVSLSRGAVIMGTPSR